MKFRRPENLNHEQLIQLYFDSLKHCSTLAVAVSAVTLAIYREGYDQAAIITALAVLALSLFIAFMMLAYIPRIYEDFPSFRGAYDLGLALCYGLLGSGILALVLTADHPISNFLVTYVGFPLIALYALTRIRRIREILSKVASKLGS